MKTTSKILIAFVALTWVCTIILFGIEHEKSQKNSSNNDIYITAIDSSFTSISPNIKVLQIDKTGNNWWGDIRITPTYSKTNASVSIPDYLLNYVNIKQQNDTTILTLNIRSSCTAISPRREFINVRLRVRGLSPNISADTVSHERRPDILSNLNRSPGCILTTLFCF